jgi:hypothetical protein
MLRWWRYLQLIIEFRTSLCIPESTRTSCGCFELFDTEHGTYGTLKCKVVIVLNYLSTTPWRRVREWRYCSNILDLGSGWRWVVSFTPQLLYFRWNRLRYPLDRRLSKPQSQSRRCGVEKYPCFCRESNSGRPARSLPMYWLRYPGNNSVYYPLYIIYYLNY